MWLLLALGALVAGAGVVWHERTKAGTAAAPLLTPATFEGLTKGRTYRVWAKLASGYGKGDTYEHLEQDLRETILVAGFSEVLLANEDPTDQGVWTFLARWGQDASGGSNVSPLGIYLLEEVDDVPVPVDYPRPPPVLDASLSFAEANAVGVALAREVDVSKLYSFAKVMALDFPVAQSLLKAKADILVKPVTPESSASFGSLQQGGSVAIPNVMAAPMAQAALLAFRAQAGSVR